MKIREAARRLIEASLAHSATDTSTGVYGAPGEPACGEPEEITGLLCNRFAGHEFQHTHFAEDGFAITWPRSTRPK